MWFVVMCCSYYIMLCGFFIVCCSHFIRFCVFFFIMFFNIVLTWCIFIIMSWCNNFIITSLCGVVLSWCIEVVQFFVLLSWCDVVTLLCGLVSSLCGLIITWCGFVVMSFWPHLRDQALVPRLTRYHEVVRPVFKWVPVPCLPGGSKTTKWQKQKIPFAA